MVDDIAHDRKTNLWVAAGRWLLGAFSLVGGLTWALFAVHGPTAAVDLTIGIVFAVVGLVLLMPHRIRLPRLVTTVTMILFAVAGTAVGLVSARVRTCCEFAYIEDRGWPFAWAQRGAVADDWATAERLAHGADWTVDFVAVATDALFWSYVGMVLVVIGVLVRYRRA
ncbi:hypothetical protein ACQP2F_42410 [Actinoplanes sp. CA-030573]|uniref:hypothetical protein n=1 Tax=Actinoplanes sp. CA-030573 TaxID=3239898 RepID=UPI003D8A6D13